MKKVLFSVFVILSLHTVQVSAQCAMCQRVAESSRDAHQNKVGKGLNNGILYLMTLPYLMGGIGLIYWYKNRKKN